MAFRIIKAGCMVMKMPMNRIATSLMAPQVKWFSVRTLALVVRKLSHAEARMIAISITAGQVSVTSPRIGMPRTVPSALRNKGRLGRVPLKSTATTMAARKIRLCRPAMRISVPGLLISGLRPSAISLR